MFDAKQVKPGRPGPIMRAPLGLLQRKCACGGAPGVGGECMECNKKRLDLQRKQAGGGGAKTAPPIVHEVLSSPGRPLKQEVRSFMEPRFGHDFSRVRIHADSQSAESARSVDARAYTAGQHIVFGNSCYTPESFAGRQLLAHELAHTIQQREATPVLQSELVVGGKDDRWEREAEAAAKGEPVHLTPIGALLQRQENTVDVELVPADPQEVERLRQQGVDLPQVSPQTYAAIGGVVAQKTKAPKDPCAKTIFAEGDCKHLATKSAWVCCDPENGFKRPGKTESVAEKGKKCPSQRWTPLFTCDHDCETAEGCEDGDNWMAIPKSQFKKTKCDEPYTICANGQNTDGYVRDKSDKEMYEVSPGIQNTLGVKVGASFRGAIYPPGTALTTIDTDPCCYKP